MYQELISLIELCLVDGVISEKERNVIFNKSKSLNITDDECEVIIDSLIHKHNKKSIDNKKIKDKSELSEKSESEVFYYTELEDINNLKKIIERNNEKLKEVDNLIPVLFKEWKNNNLIY